MPKPIHDAWYAIRVRSNFENSVSDNLQGKGYDVFLPLYSDQRRWSDRVKKVTTALFPGYLFCRFNVQERLLPILTTPGVVAIVGSGKTPLPVDDQEISDIRSILRSGLAVKPWPFLAVGSEVYIEDGPLAGVEGVITNTDKVYRLILSVSLLGRSVAVEIDREWARPVPSHIRTRALTAA
jgi:transcription antitermination factor NusG